MESVVFAHTSTRFAGRVNARRTFVMMFRVLWFGRISKSVPKPKQKPEDITCSRKRERVSCFVGRTYFMYVTKMSVYYVAVLPFVERQHVHTIYLSVT